MPSFRGYRPDRKQEIIEKARRKAKESQKRKLKEKRNNYKIRDDPLDDRI